jgi:cell division transport system permease protein
MKNWIVQHARALAATLARLAQAPISGILNIGVIGIALALPAGLYLFVSNLQGYAADLSPAPQVSLFLALDASREDTDGIKGRLAQHAGVARYRYVSRDDALERMKRSTGLADVTEGLARNPLPDAFIVDARQPSPEALEGLRVEFSQWPHIAHVQLDSVWARRLEAVVQLGRVAVTMLAAVLGCGLVAVTFNTIRLQLLTRREEIEVAKLIGATDAYIRRPFLYYGAVLGLAGGLAAWLIVALGVMLTNNGLADLSQLYGLQLHLRHFAPVDAARLLLVAAVLGWLGAWLSVEHHLAAVAPATS